jgi:hypothetical protein
MGGNIGRGGLWKTAIPLMVGIEVFNFLKQTAVDKMIVD